MLALTDYAMPGSMSWEIVRQGAPRRRSVDGCLAAETAPGSLERLKQAETPWVCSGKSSSQTDRTICSIGSGTRPYADLERLVTGHASPDERNDEPLAHISSSALLGMAMSTTTGATRRDRALTDLGLSSEAG